MDDYSTLTLWIRIFLVWAAICATSLPLIYSLYPWRTRRFGQLFMFQAVSFAVAIDVSTAFSIWPPKNVYVIFVTDLVILTMIALSTMSLMIQMVRMNRPPKRRGRHAIK